MNRIVLISPEGKEKYVDSIKNCEIIFNGDNSCIKIHEPYIKINRLIAVMGNNCHIEIGNNIKIVDVLHINASADFCKCIIGGGCTFNGVDIIMCDEKKQKVTIGNDCLFSNCILIRPSDGHAIISTEDETVLNRPENITIGNHVWFGFQAIALKGAIIPDGCVVGLRSVVTRGNFEENSVLAGQPAKMIRKNIKWSHANTDSFLAAEEQCGTESGKPNGASSQEKSFRNRIKELFKVGR